MPEHLAFQQIATERGAVDSDKGFITAGTVLVDGLCKHFFASPGLSGEQDGNIRGGNLACQRNSLLYSRRTADDSGKRILFAYSLLLAVGNGSLFHRLCDQGKDFIVVVTFGDIVKRTVLDSLYSVGDITVGRKQDHFRKGTQAFQFRNKLHTAPVRQANITEHHFGIILFELLDTHFAVGCLEHFITFQPDNTGQEA